MPATAPDDATKAGGRIALVSLHAGYSHSSPAMESILACSMGEPFYADMRCFEALVNAPHQDLLDNLYAWQPAILGFSTYLWNVQAVLRLADVLKHLLPACRVVLGGPEAGPRGRELLQTRACVDYVVAGEGEAAFRDLLRWLCCGEGSPHAISGLHFRCDERIVSNPVRPLPVAAIPSSILSGLANFDKPLVYWETSRGCPFRCSFCSSATERLRVFPMARIEAELKVLAGLRNKTVKLLDRSFHLGRARTRELLERFAATPTGLRFHLELNPDRISEQALAIFRRAEPGKFQFEIGVQTLQEPVLDAVQRKMAVPKALENIRRLVAMHRHPVHLDLIVGLPGEDAGQCADSLDRVFALYPDHLQLGTLKLLPGTPLRERAHQLGYRWDPAPPYEVLGHPCLDFSELARFKHYAALLERLWNSGYLRNTLAGLVESVFDGRLSRCFEALLEAAGKGLATENLQPDSLFTRMADFVVAHLPERPELGEWLLWDYARYSLVNRKTPAWIARRLGQGERLSIDGTRRRLPVLSLSTAAVRLVNRLSGTDYPAGRYALWPRQHKQGRPVEIFTLSSDRGEGRIDSIGG